MSVDKMHLVTIFELFTFKKMINAFNKKWGARNTACFC